VIAGHLARPEISVWVLYHGNDVAGYFELAGGDDGSVEIAYFGLTGPYIGRGLGKHLLTCAVEQSWAMGASRVWLHTCTLDHPAALPNYHRRGFSAFKSETYTVER
jgi:GNAT superfamily N-acetyltransferase